MSVIADHMSKELLRAGPDESIAEAAQAHGRRGTSAPCSSWTVIASRAS